MDVSDLLGRLSGEGGVPDPARLVAAVTDVFNSQGGIDGLVEKLRSGGLGGVVDSWISTGSNEPVSPQQLGDALGPDTVQRLSASSGFSIQSLLPMLAAFLPMIIDHLTPGGNLPKEGGVGSPDDIGDLIGGLLSGSGPLGGLFGQR